jgi:hypothetical protein
MLCDLTCSPISHAFAEITSRPPLASTLASAICSRRCATDICHTLSTSNNIDDIAEALYHALSILEGSNDRVSESWAWEILGVAIEAYR